MGKFSLLTVAGFIATFGWIQSNLDAVSEDYDEYFNFQYNNSVARASANSMANLTLGTLEDSSAWGAGYAGVGVGDGTGASSIVDSGTDTTLIPAMVRVFGSGLSGGHRDHEDSENLAANQITIHKGGESHQVDVHGIEHQLNAHQHAHRIAAVDQAPNTDAKEHGGHQEVGLQGWKRGKKIAHQ